jgi:hypothetical protein
MRKTQTWLAAWVVLSMASAGCAVVPFRSETGRHRGGLNSGSGHAECHPSQYWDGQTCRHKGKGQGARKHDG